MVAHVYDDKTTCNCIFILKTEEISGALCPIEHIVLSKDQTSKALISLRACAGLSVPLLLASDSPY